MKLFSCFTKNLTKPKTTKDFIKFSKESYEYLIAQQDFCKSYYNLSSYGRWDYDQETGLIEFSDSGVVKLRIKYENVGSVSTVSNTWLWAWDNQYLLPQVKSEIIKLKDFGKKMNFKRLTKAKWCGDEYDGWEMTAIAANIMNAKGAYRVPSDNLFSFFIFKEIEDLRE